jgi:hypothetical protein
MTGTIAIAAQTAETIITVHVAIARGHHQFTEGSIITHAPGSLGIAIARGRHLLTEEITITHAHALGSLDVAIARKHHHLAQVARMIVWPCHVDTHNSARAPI